MEEIDIKICLKKMSNKRIAKKYNTIWNKVHNLLKREFDSEPVCNDKYIKAKISI